MNVEVYPDKAKTVIKTVIIKLDAVADLTLNGAKVKLDYQIYNVIGFKMKYAQLRNTTTVPVIPRDGAIVIVHSSLGGDIMESNYRLANATDTESVNAIIHSDVVGWFVSQGVYDQMFWVSNRKHHFQSSKPVDGFTLYITDGANNPLIHTTPYTIEMIIDFYVSC